MATRDNPHGTGSSPVGEHYLAAIFGKPESIGGSSPAAVQLRMALRDARDGWATAYAKHGKLQSDLTRTQAQRIIAGAEAMRKAEVAAQTAVATAKAQAEAELTERRARMARALRPTDSALQGADAEVRSYLRGLKADDRQRIIAQAKASGDLDTIRALASGQPWLSGLTPEQHAHMRDDYLSVAATDDWQEVQALEDGIARVERTANEVRKHAEHYGDYREADRLISSRVEE